MDETWLQRLNPEQRRVVETGDGPCLVLAGAGSGKTKTITHRVAHLIHQGVDPSSILLLTFTNKAAQEMISRVRSLVGEAAHRVCGGTFHSVAHRLLRGSNTGVRFTILDQDDAKDLLSMLHKQAAREITSTKRLPSPSTLLALISYAKNSKTPLEEVLEDRLASSPDLHDWCVRLANVYEARKRNNRVWDFDDLLVSWRDQVVMPSAVRDELQKRFRYILVDEYQDTNALQAEIVEELAKTHRNLLVVGDDAQSIYSFRAATIDHILQFPKHFADARVFTLTTNYRSTPEILAVANESIARNERQYEKELTAVRPHAEKPKLIRAPSARSEASYVVREIEQHVARGGKRAEVAVLFRAAFHSQSLEFELLKHAIPYEYRGGMKFFERAHIKDLLATVRLFENVRDEVSWVRTLKRLPGIGAVSAAGLASFAASFETLAEALLPSQTLKLSAKVKTSWSKLATELTELLPFTTKPAELMTRLVDQGFREYLLLEYPDGADRLEDIAELVTFARGYNDLSTFLTDVTLAVSDIDDVETAQDTVILSTIHQAKGLEWKKVFLIHASEGKFPTVRSFESEADIEEERRLFYVAVTRAVDELTIIAPLTFGTPPFEASGASLFVEELPSRLFVSEELPFDRSRPMGSAPSRRFAFDDEGPTIILNDLGERVASPPSRPTSFLRSIDEL